jgi:hypothetical protein
MLYELMHDVDNFDHKAGNYLVRNPDCLSRLVLMTRMYYGFKCRH